MRAARPILLAVLALSVGLGSAAHAGAAEPVGSATLAVGKGKWKALERNGIALTAVGKADGEGRSVRLSGTGGRIGEASASLTYSGALELSAGEGRAGRSVKLTGLRVELGGRSILTAKLGSKRRVVFDLRGGRLTIERANGSALLRGAKLRWRSGLAAALDRRLGAKLPRGVFGSLRVGAATILDRPPQSGAISGEPLLLARPATAVDVASATLAWHVRDSWIRYLNTAQAPEPMEGAVAQAPIQENNHPCPDRPSGTNPTLVYSYDFPFAHGWYDPPSGTAALYYGGGVRFSFPSHGIDVTARNPEIEINGAASRAILRMRGAAETPYPDQRVALLGLTPSVPVATGPGAFGFPAPLRGTLTADGQTVFAGFYPPPNDGFGCMAITFSIG